MSHNDQTDPLYQQLIRDEEVELSRQKRERGKRHNKKRNQLRNDPSLKHGPEGPFRDYAPEVPEPSHGVPVNRFFEILLATRDPWRLIMGSAVIFLLLNLGASRGWISVPGLSQLAEAQSVTEIRTEQLDGQIENAVREHCLAQTGKAKTYFWKKIKELETKYYTASQMRADVPTCKDLGVPDVPVSEP